MCLFFDDPNEDTLQKDMEADQEVAQLLASFSSIDQSEEEREIMNQLNSSAGCSRAYAPPTPVKFKGFTPVAVSDDDASAHSSSPGSEDDLLGDLNMSIDALVNEIDAEDAVMAEVAAEGMEDVGVNVDCVVDETPPAKEKTAEEPCKEPEILHELSDDSEPDSDDNEGTGSSKSKKEPDSSDEEYVPPPAKPASYRSLRSVEAHPTNPTNSAVTKHSTSLDPADRGERRASRFMGA